VTQEFHISVTPVGNDEYLVRTERVAPGVPLAEEQMRWPIDDWLAQARQLMNDPLLGLLQSDPASSGGRGVAALGAVDLTQPPLSLVELGQHLYGALFQGTLRDSWVTAQGIAQHRNETLRLRLGLKGARLPRLPWEVLYGNDTPTERSRSAGVGAVSRPLTAGTHVIFSRYQPNARLAIESLRAADEPNQPLRVLMVIAAPTDRERLELEREAQQLQQELHAQSIAAGGDNGLPEIQLTLLKQPGREQLTQALEQGHYQVLHYAGHSDLGSGGGSLYLVNRRTGLTEILTGNDLAGLLVNNHIRLAVFNSCRGAHTAASNSANHHEQNLAETLVSRGVPAVLAMAEQIPDHVALTLTSLFYRNLKSGCPIDLSLSRARQGLITTYGSHQLYWALPILYLHPDFDGALMAIGQATSPAVQPALLPQPYGALPLLTAAAAVASPGAKPVAGRSAAIPNRRPVQATIVDEHAAELSDDWSDLEDGDEEDASLVADLLRQLTPPSSTASVNASVPSGGTAAAPIATPQVTQNLAPTSPNLSQPPAASVPSSGQPQRRWLSLVGALSAAIAAAVGFWSYSQFQHGGFVLQFPDSNPISFGNRDLQTAEPREVKTIAINHFNQQRYEEGQKAVAALLDRGELREAAEALAAVPTRVDTPEINFLWGRLAWQGSDTGSPVHTLQDARRYWELAAKAAPDNAKYQEALGFAYYAENQPLRAMDAWTQALALSDEDTANDTSSGATPAQAVVAGSSNALPTNPKGQLTTYAGIALALWITSVDQYPSERNNLLRKATQIYEMVQRSDPNNFQVEALRRNWLWKDGAIRDWQALSRLAL
jgi:tetratricopeptide (TPR) repeat protein